MFCLFLLVLLVLAKEPAEGLLKLPVRRLLPDDVLPGGLAQQLPVLLTADLF